MPPRTAPQIAACRYETGLVFDAEARRHGGRSAEKTEESQHLRKRRERRFVGWRHRHFAKVGANCGVRRVPRLHGMPVASAPRPPLAPRVTPGKRRILL